MSSSRSRHIADESFEAERLYRLHSYVSGALTWYRRADIRGFEEAAEMVTATLGSMALSLRLRQDDQIALALQNELDSRKD